MRSRPARTPPKKVVVVGGGPAGLEAARVLGARGHRVVLFEANSEPGGQIRIAASLERRRDLIGISDWRVSEAKLGGVDIRCGAYAETADVLAERPDVVIIATGGLPNHDLAMEGSDLLCDTWDILSGSVRPLGRTLVYDDIGAQQGLDATEYLVLKGCAVEYVTPGRVLGPGVGPLTAPGYLKVFADAAVTVTLGCRIVKVARLTCGALTVRLDSEYSGASFERVVDQVVVEHGTVPNDELYKALLEGSSNGGEVDYDALIAIRPQAIVRNPEGKYQLFRIGDAVAGRNIHAATFDAMRYCLPI